MDDTNVCTPPAAEADASTNKCSSPNVASVTDADKVINTKSDNFQVKGDMNEADLLKGLLTDSYCHLCEAVLCFESQRLSHYEGKKHAQKLKVYLQAKRAEVTKDSSGTQRTMSTDRDRFCELCNMVFSSTVVANSHYGGKVHSKNLRKQGLHPRGVDRCAEVCNLPSPPRETDHSEQKSAAEDGTEHPAEPLAASTMPPTAEADPTDLSKYCALCSASFNNAQTALQHYNGRKHQRKQARQSLLQDLEIDAQQANSLMCRMCNVQFNSVEMYQAHMLGNKHQTREKKVADFCNSQQKVYGTFADELADYIQGQKARGIAPKANQVVTQQEDEDEHQEGSNMGKVMQRSHPDCSLPPNCRPPHQSHPGSYCPVEMWRPSYRGPPPPWPPHGQEYLGPPPAPLSGSSHFRSQPGKKRKLRNDSSSSSYTTSSSSSSSYSSSSSESEDSEYRYKEKRKTVRSRRDRDTGRGKRDVGSDKDERRQHRKRVRRCDSEERKREQSGESDERRREKSQNHSKHRRREKKFLDENSEVEKDQRAMDKFKPEDTVENRKQLELQDETNVEQKEGGQSESSIAKCRKERKKKTKEKEDTRTEEEKLWDDSILGC